MERTTIYLDPGLKRQLKMSAARKHTTEAAIIREALRHYLKVPRTPKVRPVGKSTDGGVASRVGEALLELGFGRE